MLLVCALTGVGTSGLGWRSGTALQPPELPARASMLTLALSLLSSRSSHDVYVASVCLTNAG